MGRIVDRARAGRLPIIGSGASLVDTTYLDNAAEAIVAALDAAERAHGERLVISNGEPRPIGELVAAICRAAGVEPPHRRIATPLALLAGSWPRRPSAARTALGAAPTSPPLTRFLVEQLSTAHWFDQRRTGSSRLDPGQPGRVVSAGSERDPLQTRHGRGLVDR